MRIKLQETSYHSKSTAGCTCHMCIGYDRFYFLFEKIFAFYSVVFLQCKHEYRKQTCYKSRRQTGKVVSRHG